MRPEAVSLTPSWSETSGLDSLISAKSMIENRFCARRAGWLLGVQLRSLRGRVLHILRSKVKSRRVAVGNDQRRRRKDASDDRGREGAAASQEQVHRAELGGALYADVGIRLVRRLPSRAGPWRPTRRRRIFKRAWGLLLLLLVIRRGRRYFRIPGSHILVVADA